MNLAHYVIISLLCAFLLNTGCVTSQRVSTLLASAPRERFRANTFDQVARSLQQTGEKSPMRTESFALPHSAVSLSATIITPGRFPLKLNSQYTSQSFEETLDSAQTGPMQTHRFAVEFSYNIQAFEAQPAKGCIFLLHGYGQSKESLLPWGLLFAQQGYQAILVDLRGHGQSGGRRIYFGDKEADDMMELLDTLQSNLEMHSNIGVFGYSLGSGIALKWAARDPRVKTVAAIAPYGSLPEAIPEVLKMGGVRLSPQKLDRALGLVESRGLADWERCAIYHDIAALGAPVLIARGELDTISSDAVVTKLIGLSSPGSKRLDVPLANHNYISYYFHELKQPVLDWFSRHLGEPSHPAAPQFASHATGRSALLPNDYATRYRQDL